MEGGHEQRELRTQQALTLLDRMIEVEKEDDNGNSRALGRPINRRGRGWHFEDMGAPSGHGISAGWGLAAFQRLGMTFALTVPHAWSVLYSEFCKVGNLVFQRTAQNALVLGLLWVPSISSLNSPPALSPRRLTHVDWV